MGPRGRWREELLLRLVADQQVIGTLMLSRPVQQPAKEEGCQAARLSRDKGNLFGRFQPESSARGSECKTQTHS